MSNSSNWGGRRSGSGKPSPWGEGPTKVVRVPERFASQEILQAYLFDLPELIDGFLEELEPRQTSERVKLCYEKLLILKAVYSSVTL